ncbi:MAG TPA: patatin [Epsilonproteobacteria bacterium]|nr:patatin [Campylobacterota bacterium]HHD79076.1 patatin [Campylobacterota bacterium]
MKISLVLSGGAARGAFHLGVIEALKEKGIEIEAISGSSIGAIIATSLSANVSPKEQLEIFKSKAFRKSFKFNGFKKGFLKIDQKKAVLKELVPIKNLEDGNIKVHITTIDLERGDVVRFNEGEAIPLCIASSAVVPLFKPIAYKDYQLVDGGIMDNLPVYPLKEYGFPIVAVDLHPQEDGFKNSLWGIIKRTIFLMWRASVQEQMKECDYYISNEKLKNYSLFSFKNLDELFQLGYETALEHELLQSFN